MNWKTAMQIVKGVLSGVGIVAGFAAIANSAALGKTLERYLASTGPEIYSGIQSQAAQAVTDSLKAGMVFYDSVRLLLLFGGIAMICFFGITLAETLKRVPVDVLVDSQSVDTLRRRAAHAAGRIARRLDPEETPRVVHRQEVLPDGDQAPIEFATVEAVSREAGSGDETN